VKAANSVAEQHASPSITHSAGQVPVAQRGVIDLIFRSGTSFDGFTSQMRRTFGINAHERLAIAALWERGPLTMTELGTWIPLSRAAVTTLVDRLEAALLVERRSDADDRRRTVVHLSGDAVSRMVPVIQPWIDQVHEVVEELGEAEWSIISGFLERLTVVNQGSSGQLAALSDAEIQALSRAAEVGA
jgi:DNA-binding MarR family transcriptional regulator